MARRKDKHSPHPRGVTVFDSSAEGLVTSHLPALEDPAGHGWELVKRNDSRSVYRGQLDGRDFYLKQYHSRRWIHRIRRALGRCDALREMRFARLLLDSGVPTAQPLAARCDGSREWSATWSVAPAEPGDEWHERQLQNGSAGQQAIREATVALARQIGRMHRAGIVHQDLHCGNILIRTDTVKPAPLVMDLHRMARRRRLSRRARAANLAQLFHDRLHRTTRTDRLRFLRQYLRASEAGGTLRGWQLLVEWLGERHTRRQHAQRDRRILGTNRYFAPIQPGKGWKGHVILASKRQLGGSTAAEETFTIEQWRGLLANPEQLCDPEGAKIIKASSSSQILRRTIRLGSREVDVFIKRAKRKHVSKILVDCFRPSRALRAFRLGHELLTRHIATALPMAAIERRVGPFLTDSILITETVHAEDLWEFTNTWLANPPLQDVQLSAAEQKQLAQEVLWQLGRMLQQLHDNCFAHRDLKATNIRVRWSLGAGPDVVLVDLDGLSHVRFMTTRRKLRGLMRLNVSLLQCPAVNHAGRLRMLLGYLRRPGMGRIHFKPYWRLLEEWSARKLQRQIRSRRQRQKASRRPA